MVAKKEKRSSVLYTRIRPSIKRWIKKEMKRLGYKTEADFMEQLISTVRSKKPQSQ